MVRLLVCVAILSAMAAACAGGESAPSDRFCISDYRDDVNAYLAENADSVAEQLVRNNLVVLREPAEGQRFRIAERSNGPCRPSEELVTATQLQTILNDIAYSPPAVGQDQCSVQVPFRSEQESRTMFRYFGVSGLRGLAVTTQGPGFEILPDGTRRDWPLSGSVTSSDSCDALNAIARALTERRDRMN